MTTENMTNREIIKKMVNKNTIDFDLMKLAEECTELSEVLIKMVTKPNRREERMEHLVEEMGDVKLRMEVLVTRLGFNKVVDARYEEKLAYFHEKLIENKYDTV